MKSKQVFSFLPVCCVIFLALFACAPASAQVEQGKIVHTTEVVKTEKAQTTLEERAKPSILSKIFNFEVFYNEELSSIQKVNKFLDGILFFDVSFETIKVHKKSLEGEPLFDDNGKPVIKTVEVPFLVAFLAFGALFFSLFYRFISFRLFFHGIQVVRGKFDKNDHVGEISHFRALTSALSATVGLGNIAGVAVAISLGGPGAMFWMIVLAFFGMASKFSSCTLSQLYRVTNKDGSISGGPMYYLDLGMRQMGGLFRPLGKVLALMYAFMVMGGAIGGGNMFQANQTVEAFVSSFDLDHQTASWGIGILLVILAGVVVIGGIKRIGAATSRIVPVMCLIYIVSSLYVILVHFDQIPNAIREIFGMAFYGNAFFGGIVGVVVMGFQRAAFSNEAGLGSAAIAHAAAKTDEPVREGIVAMLGPFIDTVLVCSMTALMVVVTGAWKTNVDGSLEGVAITMAAFESVVDWLPFVLTACIAFFAFSTMIAWCYYGERGWIYIMDHFYKGFGVQTVIVFRIVFVAAILLGATEDFSDVIGFTDLMILSMSFPNILGSILLAPKVWPAVKDYWDRYRSGAMHGPRNYNTP